MLAERVIEFVVNYFAENFSLTPDAASVAVVEVRSKDVKLVNGDFLV